MKIVYKYYSINDTFFILIVIYIVYNISNMYYYLLIFKILSISLNYHIIISDKNL